MTDRTGGLAVLLACLAAPLFAQDIPTSSPAEEPEAPEALFDQKLGDVGVVLEADGTWTSRLAGGWGTGGAAGAWLPALGYPGFERGAVFAQTPDFTLTLRLLERYYVELSYGGTVEDRTFLAGYEGKDDEAVQWVKAGNGAFSLVGRADAQPAAGRRGAAAAGAGFRFGPVDTEVAVRYEDGSRETRSFLGYRDADASTVALDSWIRGRFFRLPGPYPLTGVRLAVEDPAGSLVSGGVRYRLNADAETAVDPATGEVRLPAPATRRYLVTWSGAAAAVAARTKPLGIPEEAFTVSDGADWYLLVRPGDASSFELRNRYPAAKGLTGAVTLTDPSGTEVSGWSVSRSPAQDWFEVSGSEEAPFASAAGGTLAGIYPLWTSGRAAEPPAASVLPWRFELPRGDAPTSINLGNDVLADSLTVIRNGSATTAYTFEPGTGKLTFTGPVFDTDQITVSLQRRTAVRKASDLSLWEGGRWTLSEDQALEWNLQGRWNLEQGRYTTEDLQSPGRFTGTLAWSGKAADWTWSASATAGALLADSTGRRRLAGWTGSGTQATLDGSSLRPSAVPRGISAFPGLSETNRSELLFRDYWTTDPLTGSPQLSVWGTAGIGPQTTSEGGWTGPYLVRGDGVRTDRLAVLETAFTASGQWAAAQAFFDAGLPKDLRSSGRVTLPVRLSGGQTGDRLFLQIGGVSEDFDSTGAVRKVEYRSWPALAFRPSGISRYFAVPEGSSWGNDAQGDGAAGQDGALVTAELSTAPVGFDPTDDSWQTLVYEFSPEEKQKLVSATGWRLVLVSASSGTRILKAASAVLDGSGWSVTADGSTAGQVSLAEESDSSRTGGHNLSAVWSGRNPTGWTAEGRVSPFRPATFGSLSFRFWSQNPGESYVLEARNGQDRLGRVSWTAAAGWQTVKISLGTGALTVDGVAAGTVSGDLSSGTWDRLRLGYAGSSAAGAFRITEIDAVDPRWEPVLATRAEARWRQAEPWPSADWPLLTGASAVFGSEHTGTASSASWLGRASASGTLSVLKVSGEAEAAVAAGRLSGHGAYDAVLPLDLGVSVTLADKFSDRGQRASSVRIGLPWVGTAEASAQAQGLPTLLDQTYLARWTSPVWLPGLTLSAQLNQSAPAARSWDGFAGAWQDSLTWYLPPTAAPAPYQRLQGDAGAEAAFGSLGLAAAAQASSAQTVVSGAAKETPAGSWSLRLPWKDPAGWSLTASVQKRAEAAFSGGEPQFPGPAAARTWQKLTAQPGGWVGLPFAELTSGELWSQEPQSGTVESSAALEGDRPAASDWTDLVFPASGSTRFTAGSVRDGGASARYGTVSAAAQGRALNLFGSLGSAPAAQWFQTDTYFWSVSGSVSSGDRTSDRKADAAVALTPELVFRPAEKLSLAAAWQGRWGGTDPAQTAGLKPKWTLSNPADLPVDLPGWLSPRTFRREFISELSGAADWGWAPDTPVLRNLQAAWKGRFLLSDKSEAALGTRFGIQWQTGLFVTGLEATLDLILSF